MREEPNTAYIAHISIIEVEGLTARSWKRPEQERKKLVLRIGSVSKCPAASKPIRRLRTFSRQNIQFWWIRSLSLVCHAAALAGEAFIPESAHVQIRT